MRRAWNFSVYIVTLWASLVTIILGWAQSQGQMTPLGRVAFVFLSITAVVLFLAVIVQEYRYSRKARYAEAVSYLNQAFGEIHDLTLVLNEITSTDQIIVRCKRIMNHLAAAFSLISATKCSVCIKVMEGDPSKQVGSQIRPKVVTLCRDDTSPERTVDVSRGVEHWIDQNTDFEDLLQRAGTPQYHFFANNLPGIRGYKNSSFTVYGNPHDVNDSTPSFFSGVIRNERWPLPYKSTIVVPIAPRLDQQCHDYRLAGYLCVDSRPKGAFRRNYDVDLLAGVADCLYDVINRYCQLAWASVRRSHESEGREHGEIRRDDEIHQAE